MPCRVLIVEDDPMARQLLHMIIDRAAGYRVAKTIESAILADVCCSGGGIDLVIMDIRTALQANGLDAAEKLKRKYPAIRVIIVTSMPEFSYLSRAREIPVDGFWYKDADHETLLDMMDLVMAGQSVFPDASPDVQLGNVKSGDLTQRELEVLRALTTGDPDNLIAEKLHLSVHTVKSHIQHLREKTGFRNRTELAVKARESGLVIPEDS